jgi:predicted nucleotidyltransferase
MVDRAVRSWTAAQVEQRTDIVALGYFGSYARGDWGVGSDLDIIAVLKKADQPFERRSAGWDLNSLPVPAEILVYSCSEWEKQALRETRFARMLKEEVVWTYRTSQA